MEIPYIVFLIAAILIIFGNNSNNNCSKIGINDVDMCNTYILDIEGKSRTPIMMPFVVYNIIDDLW